MEQSIVDLILGYAKDHIAVLVGVIVLSEALPFLPWVKANGNIQLVKDVLSGLFKGGLAILEEIRDKSVTPPANPNKPPTP